MIIRMTSGVVRHELEITAESYSLSENETTEYAVGVKPGDSNTLEFTEISMMNDDSTISDIFVLSTRVEDNEQNISMKVGDQVEAIVKDVDGYQISIYMIFHSSLDGDVTSDSWTINIDKVDEKSDGPMLVIPTDPVMIDQMYKEFANVSIEGDKVFIKIQHDDYSNTYISEYVYNLTTGWVTKMTQIKLVDGIQVEKFVAESVGTLSSNTDSIPTLTPIPLWPTIFFLIIAASFYRRKR